MTSTSAEFTFSARTSTPFGTDGASDDLLSGKRKRDEVTARGRWLSDVSVRRYGKAARAMKEAARLGPVATEYGDRVRSKLSRFLDGAERCPAAPASVRLAVEAPKRRAIGKRSR